jgi:aminobenzoyl-glutamate transport protein
MCWLFGILTVFVALISPFTGSRNLLSLVYWMEISKDLFSIFGSFAPLHAMVMCMMGVAVLQRSGVFPAFSRFILSAAPRYLLFAAMALLAIISNIISDAAVIIMPTIFAAAFRRMGYHPWGGIVLGFAASDALFTIQPFVAVADTVLAAITGAALPPGETAVSVHPLMNWYFNITATPFLILVSVLVTKHRIIPSLGSFDPVPEEARKVSEGEKKGLLRLAAFSSLFVLALFLLSPLLSATGGFLHGAGLYFLFCILAGLLFGKTAGTIRSLKEIPALFSEGVQGTTSFIVTALPAALFIRFFKDSGIGETLFSLILKSAGAASGGIPGAGILFFILLVLGMNFFITSASMKWMMLAPLALPVFSGYGLSPAAILLAFRIGSCATNIISPFEYYLPVILALMEANRRENDPPVGPRALFRLTMPYAAAYAGTLLFLFFFWFFMELSPGPGTSFMIR